MAPKKKPAEQAEQNAAEEPTFEQSLQELEQIVQQLEDGGLGLSESLTRYEEGVKHLKRCYDALRNAERRIELLAGVDAEGKPITSPFDDEALSLEDKQQSRGRRRSQPTPQTPSETREVDVDEPGELF